MMNLITLSFDGMILGYFGSPRQWNGEFGSFMMFGEMARHPSVKARHLDSFFGCKNFSRFIDHSFQVHDFEGYFLFMLMTWRDLGSCDSCLILLVLDFCRARMDWSVPVKWDMPMHGSGEWRHRKIANWNMVLNMCIYKKRGWFQKERKKHTVSVLYLAAIKIHSFIPWEHAYHPIVFDRQAYSHLKPDVESSIPNLLYWDFVMS